MQASVNRLHNERFQPLQDQKVRVSGNESQDCSSRILDVKFVVSHMHTNLRIFYVSIYTQSTSSEKRDVFIHGMLTP